MSEWTNDPNQARAWIERSAKTVPQPHEILNAPDGAPGIAVRLALPDGENVTVSAVLRAGDLRFDLIGAIKRPPSNADWGQSLATCQTPVVARLFPGPSGQMLDLSCGVPVLTPEHSIDVAAGFVMMGAAATTVRGGGLPAHQHAVELPDDALDRGWVALRDPSGPVGLEPDGIARTPAGAAASVSVQTLPGAVIIAAAARWPDVATHHNLDASLLRVNQMAPAGAVARDTSGAIQASVPILLPFMPAGPQQVIWAARLSLTLLDVVAMVSRSAA